MVVSTPPRLDSRHTQMPYLRGFASVSPNFIRSSLNAATGIIVEALPPYPAAKNEASPRPTELYPEDF